MLVEAAWAAAKAPGPLHAFLVRVRAGRGHQVAAVAVARKLTVLVWHMLTKETDYLWARPSLVAHKMRAMELQAGKPQKKGNKPGPAYAYNIKNLVTRRCIGCIWPSKHKEATNVLSKPGVRARQIKRRADASIRQGSNEVARRRFQPMHHASPRCRPRISNLPRSEGEDLSILSVAWRFPDADSDEAPLFRDWLRSESGKISPPGMGSADID